MKITGLHHVSLLTADLERSLAFYTAVLGLPLDPGRPELGYPGAWLDLADGRQIHLLQLPNPDPLVDRPAHGGRDRHLALWVDDLTVLIDRLKQAEIAYTLSRSGRRAMFFRDPDANAIEVIEVEAAAYN